MSEGSKPPPSLLQQQLSQSAALRHSITVPAGFHANQKRYSTPNLTKDALRNMDAYEGPVPLMKAFSSVPHEGLSARNPVWTEIQSALIGAFKGKVSPNKGVTAQLVRSLGRTVSTGVVFDYLEKSLLKKGFKILCRKLELGSEEPEELLESLESVWRFFNCQLVTEVKCVFQPMGMDLQVLERALMLGFRDQVLLPTRMHDILRSEAACGRGCSLSPGLTQMLLVLQMHRDSEPPSENDVALERMVALSVKPFIGFYGVYNGSEEPQYRANVPELLSTRRRLTRRAFISRNALFRGADAAAVDADILAMVVADSECSEPEEEEDREEGEEELNTEYEPAMIEEGADEEAEGEELNAESESAMIEEEEEEEEVEEEELSAECQSAMIEAGEDEVSGQSFLETSEEGSKTAPEAAEDGVSVSASVAKDGGDSGEGGDDSWPRSPQHRHGGRGSCCYDVGPVIFV